MQAAAGGAGHQAAPPVADRPDGTLPASDTERDAVLRLLTRSVGEGRLDLAGFDERSRIAVQARTRGELATALRGLPPPRSGTSTHASSGAGPLRLAAVVPLAAERPTPASGDRGWAMLGHLLGWVTSAVGPLVLLVTRGRQSAYVRRQAAEAANFQITVLLAMVGLGFVAAATFGLGAILYVPLTLAWLVLPLVATVASACGDPYRYPWILRLVR